MPTAKDYEFPCQACREPFQIFKDLTLSNLVSNFPFKEIRPKQLEVLQQIADAINARYKYIVLEAPIPLNSDTVMIGKNTFYEKRREIFAA
jgi:hypothetical protein